MKRLAVVLSILIFAMLSYACADSINLPGNLKSIKTEAFYGDTNIRNVSLPEGIERIEEKAFANSSLVHINLPDSLTYIAKDAFEADVNLSANPGTYAYEWAIENNFISPDEKPGQLKYPQIIMNDMYESGEDIIISLSLDERADNYFLELTNLNENETTWSTISGEKPTSYTLGGYDLDAGNYIVAFIVTSDSLEDNKATKHFTITGNKLPGPTVTVDKIEVEENEEYTFTVTTTGAEKVLARDIFIGGYGTEIREVDATAMTFAYSHLTRKTNYQFSLLINNRWTEMSDPITIAPKKTIDPSIDHLENPIIVMDDSFDFREDVTFTVVQDPYAVDYYYSLYLEEEMIFGSKRIWDPVADTLWGCDLEPGNYKIILTAEDDNSNTVSATKYFSISEGTKLPAPTVTVDKTEIEEYEECTFTVNTAGAEKVLIRDSFRNGYGTEIHEVDADIMTFSFIGGVEKSYYQFSLMINGRWTEYSEKICIQPKN